MAGKNFHEAVKKDFNLRGLVSDLREQKWRGTNPGQIERTLWIGSASSIEKLAQFAVTEKEWKEAEADGFEHEIVEEYMNALAEAVSKEMDEHVYTTFLEDEAYIGQYEDMAPADLRAMGFEIGKNKKISPQMGAVKGWVVTHDGETLKAGFKNDGEAMRWLHNEYHGSVDHAVRHAGYDIVLVKDGKVAYSYKREALKRPEMSGLSDVPLPPNIERPEMWTVEAIVQAVADGFTFMVPFHDQGRSMFSPNAYWIKGQQASAHALTVGPHHTPEIGLINVTDTVWIRALAYFPHQIVPKEAWIGPINQNGAVAVHVEVDPATIDWEWLNRGHQIRVKRGP